MQAIASDMTYMCRAGRKTLLSHFSPHHSLNMVCKWSRNPYSNVSARRLSTYRLQVILQRLKTAHFSSDHEIHVGYVHPSFLSLFYILSASES